MVLQNKIFKGCTIGIVAPSSPFDIHDLNIIEENLNKLGYKIKFGKSCFRSYKGYLSGEDKLRAKDIEDMFLDKEVDGILCLRGGYGTPRILDKINYDVIKNNPKFFIGYSDITALHIAFNQRCNLITFHGVMAGTCPEWDEFTYKSLINSINYTDTLDIKNPKGEKIYTLIEGSCEGILTGGNLSLIVSTLGTNYEIDTKEKILFIEEIDESIYRLDRMLTQLDLSGKFKDCNGIIFGDFCNCKKDNKDDFELIDLLKDKIQKYNKPCILNLKSGHCKPMITLPLGAKCILDSSNKKVKFTK